MREFKLDYQHPGLGDDLSEDPFAAPDMALVKRVAACLDFHYPSHAWYVEASHKQGVVMINIPILMGQQRYVIKLHDLKSDPGMKAIVRGAGEILERFKLPRQGFDLTHWQDALKAKPIGERHYVPN